MEFSRERKDGRLRVDTIDDNEASTTGSSQSINVPAPYFVGGLTKEMAEAGAKNLEVCANVMCGWYCIGFQI